MFDTIYKPKSCEAKAALCRGIMLVFLLCVLHITFTRSLQCYAVIRRTTVLPVSVSVNVSNSHHDIGNYTNGHIGFVAFTSWVTCSDGKSSEIPRTMGMVLLTFACHMQALREHCSLSGHDPSKAPKPSKQKQSLAAVQPAVPLELTVQPIPDEVEMERFSCLPAPALHVWS